MKIKKLETVAGTDATHTVLVSETEHYDSTEAMMTAWKANPEWHGTSWRPDNGAEFKTLGEAVGWLKKLLRKHGWPEATRWIVREFRAAGCAGPGFSVALLDDGDGKDLIQVTDDEDQLWRVWDEAYAKEHSGQVYFAEVRPDGWAYTRRAKFPPGTFEQL